MPTSCAVVRGSAGEAWDQRKPTVVLQLLTPWVPPLNCEPQERPAGLSSSGDTSSATVRLWTSLPVRERSFFDHDMATVTTTVSRTTTPSTINRAIPRSLRAFTGGPLGDFAAPLRQ